MKLYRRLHWVLPLAFLCAVGNVRAGDGKRDAPTQSSATNAPDIIEVTGKLVKPGSGTNAVAFRTEAGAVYPLVRNQKSEGLFTDTNLWPKTLILKGRVQPVTHEFEVTGNLHSLRDGKRYEIYYYCYVCSIKTSEPGLCLCCRDPVELVEEPE